jgi:hypothetical protein
MPPECIAESNDNQHVVVSGTDNQIMNSVETSSNSLQTIDVVSSGHQSELVLREVVETPALYDLTPKFTSVDPDMRMDFSRMLNKPFHVGVYNWTTVQAAGATVASIGVPSTLASLNRVAASFLDLSSLYHAKMCLVVQVAGTPMHAGMLIVSALPKAVQFPGGFSGLHTMQCAPHAYLLACDASSACVEIPWYSQTKLRSTVSNNDSLDGVGLANLAVSANSDYADLVIRVVSPLAAPTSGATTLALTVSVVFKELNCFVPKASFIAQSGDVVQQQPAPSSALLDKLQSPAEAEAKEVRCKCANFVAAAMCATCCQCFSTGLRRGWDLVTENPEIVTNMVGQSLSRNVSKAIDGLFGVGRKLTGDVLDTGRSWIRAYTGLHNPNVRNPERRIVAAHRNNPNYVDAPTFYYKLDPYAAHFNAMVEEIDTEVDEGSVSFLCSKPMAVSKVTISTSTASGTCLFTAPIHPKMFRSSVAGTEILTAPLDKLASMSRYYSGNLRLTLQNCGSSFHMYKLLVVKEYYPSYEAATTAVSSLSMQAYVNNPSTVVEFSAGGQSVTIDLPMASIFDHVPISVDALSNGLSHGRVLIFLLQPLVTNGSVATTCDFVVHVSGGENFRLYGYATETLTQPSGLSLFSPVTLNDPSLQHTISGAPVFMTDDQAKDLGFRKRQDSLYERPRFAFGGRMASESSDFKDPRGVSFTPNSMKTPVVMRAQSKEVPFNRSERSMPVSAMVGEGPEPSSDHFRPILHIRDHVRRLIPTSPTTIDSVLLQSQNGNFVIDLNTVVFGSTFASARLTPMQQLATMFYGFRGGLKVKLLVTGSPVSSAYYLPPTQVVSDMGAGFTNNNRFRYRSTTPYPVLPAAFTPNMSKFANYERQGGYSLYAGPQLEVSDSRFRSSGTDYSGVALGSLPAPTDTLASNTLLEFEIPYMNVCRFVSDNTAGSATSFAGDLGKIVVHVMSQYQQNGGTYSNPDIVVTGYYGFDDTARFVYQAYSQPLVWPTIGAGAYPSTVKDTVFQGVSADVPADYTVNAAAFYTGAAAI